MKISSNLFFSIRYTINGIHSMHTYHIILGGWDHRTPLHQSSNFPLPTAPMLAVLLLSRGSYNYNDKFHSHQFIFIIFLFACLFYFYIHTLIYVKCNWFQVCCVILFIDFLMCPTTVYSHSNSHFKWFLLFFLSFFLQNIYYL